MFYRIFITLLLSLLFAVGCGKPPEPTSTLSRAVRIGDIDQLERNLYWGANPNELGPDGLTPLHVAAQKDSLVMSKILVKHQADLEALDPQGHTPLLRALIARNTIVAHYLVKQGAQFDPNQALHITASTGSVDRDVISFLLKYDVDLDHLDEQGNTPLHTAILNNQRVAAKYLINRGADLEITNQQGMTPLALAMAQKNQDIAKILRQFGAREHP
jgi:ankyrin repeat protein